VFRRFATLAATFVVAAVSAAAATAGSGGTGAPVADPAGVYALPPGYTYTDLATPCVTPEVSTESGATYPMPEDPDGKALFQAPGGQTWLLVQHELTQPRAGDFQGDAGKCFVPEQTPGDNDSDGYGSISRLTLAEDGTTVTKAEIITTGLHDLCASGITPWKTYLTNEEFPFIVDPPKPPDNEQGSGWVWEIDPATGAQTKLIGMGRFSHEQEAYASNGSWYLTDDRGDARFIYKFVPNEHRDLTTGALYGLAFNRATGTGIWVGPLNYKDPDTDMRSRGYLPAAVGFMKAEGMIATGSSNTLGGNAVYFSESGVGSDPGRVWRLDDLGNDGIVSGHVVVEGDWARLGRPDNIRFTDAGDLFIMEDHSATDFGRGPTGNVNQTWVLPRHQEGSANMILFAQTVDEATGPWFSLDNKLLYLSIQADPPRRSHIIAIRHPGGGFNQPYDR
jgi:secreted PhoX family phosphatase